MFVYFLSTIAISGGTFGLYILLFKKEHNFKFIRYYLLITVLLSLISPLLNIKVQDTFPVIETIKETIFKPSTIVITKTIDSDVVKTITKPRFSFQDILLLIYYIVTVFFLFRYFRNINTILKKVKEKQPLSNGMQAVFITNNQGIYSFFNWLFVDKKSFKIQSLQSPIILHELAHSKQKHSVDILFIQLTLCFFWFNPFMWLYKKVICENHEFLADRFVVQSGVSISSYGKIIVTSAKHQSQTLFYSGFNFIQTKTRLMMLQKRKSSNLILSTKILTIIIGCLFIFSAGSFTNKKPVIVIVDAGHGGKDSGNSSFKVEEKSINLAIAKELELLSDEKVKVILLRNDDTFISLSERMKIVGDNDARLFLSLHCDVSENIENSGIVAFTSPDNSHSDRSNKFASILISSLLTDSAKKGKVKSAPFYVLKNNPMPAVLIEMGFLSNKPL